MNCEKDRPSSPTVTHWPHDMGSGAVLGLVHTRAHTWYRGHTRVSDNRSSLHSKCSSTVRTPAPPRPALPTRRRLSATPTRRGHLGNSFETRELRPRAWSPHCRLVHTHTHTHARARARPLRREERHAPQLLTGSARAFGGDRVVVPRSFAGLHRQLALLFPREGRGRAGAQTSCAPPP